MKAKIVGKNSIQVTMTIKQAEALIAGQDSLEEHMGYSGSKRYDDTLKAQKSFQDSALRLILKQRGEL